MCEIRQEKSEFRDGGVFVIFKFFEEVLHSYNYNISCVNLQMNSIIMTGTVTRRLSFHKIFSVMRATRKQCEYSYIEKMIIRSIV